MGERNSKIRLIVRSFLKRLKESGIAVEKAYLFGSHARGHADEGSDIDVAIISRNFSGNRFDHMMFLFDVRRTIDLRLEPIPFHPDDFVKWDPLAGEILRYGIQVWPPKHNGRKRTGSRKRRRAATRKN